jgi:hypothetical protein
MQWQSCVKLDARKTPVRTVCTFTNTQQNSLSVRRNYQKGHCVQKPRQSAGTSLLDAQIRFFENTHIQRNETKGPTQDAN